MSTEQSPGAGESAPSAPSFDLVQLRHRHDGWTPERQVGFIRALAECGCVVEACRRIGMSPESAYALARRPDAQSFRVAWDMALANAVHRIEDGVFSRALNGIEIPHYYKGELVGTHRRYDERLALFILRYRKPHRYGRHLDRSDGAPPPERNALGMADLLAWVENDARRDDAGLRRQVLTQLAGEDEEGEALRQSPNLFRWGPAAAAPPEEEPEDYDRFCDDDEFDEGMPFPDVARTSSTSGRAPNRRARRSAAAKDRKR